MRRSTALLGLFLSVAAFAQSGPVSFKQAGSRPDPYYYTIPSTWFRTPGGGSTLTNGLLAYWLLAANSNDSTGTYNGTDTGMSYSSETTASVGYIVGPGAGIFNGSSSKVDVGSITLDSSNWTIAVWILPSTWGTFTRIVSWAGDGPTIYRNGTGIGIAHSGTVDWVPSGGSAIDCVAGTVCHIVISRAGSTAKIYRNAVATTNSSFSATYTSNNSAVIGASNAFGEYYNGMADEVGFWNRQLSNSEVTSLYNNGAGLAYSSLGNITSGLVAYYGLDGNGNASVGSNGTSTSMGWTAVPSVTSTKYYAVFAGGTAKINTGNIPLTATSWSMAAWIYITAAGNEHVFSYHGAGPTWNYNGLSTGTITLANNNNSGTGTGLTPSLSTWYHLVSTYDGTTFKSYVNASITANTAWSNPPYSQSDSVVLGNSNYSSLPYVGRMMGAGLWNRPLTQAEVTALYNNGTVAQYPF